jgi:hypothetical protein
VRGRVVAMKLPKLNLRDLFWLVGVVAMGLGWWLDRTPLASALAAAQQSNGELATQVKLARAKQIASMDRHLRLWQLVQKHGFELTQDELMEAHGEDLKPK